MTWGRLALVLLGAAVGYVVGFYGGLFVLLSLFGIGGAEGWQYALATIVPGGLVAGGAAAVISPSDGNRITVVVTALATALVAAVGVNLIDGDFGIAMGLGGPIVVGATGAAVHSTRSRSGSAETENAG